MIRRTRRTLSSLRGRFAAVLLPCGLAACGNLTAGGFGEAVIVVSADVASTITATQVSLVPTPEPSIVAADQRTEHDDHDHPEGQLEVEFFAYLVNDAGASVALSDLPFEVEVDLEGVEQDETLPRTVPAVDYTQLRMIFLEIEADVDAGLIINGQEVMGPIEVDFEGTLEVIRPIDLTVPDGERAEVLIGLNAASWLQAVDPTTGTVDATVFADLIEITTR